MSTTKLIVLKFGGSVLNSKTDFDLVRGEIQRFQAREYKVIAVVSAYYGVTETLICEAAESGVVKSSIEYAELISSGEINAASDLESHLVDHGVAAALTMPADFEFTASGERHAATPVSVNRFQLLAAFERSSVLVVPGFTAVDHNGDCVLLGRGGSDISAVCIAEALGLASVRLLKDVDGLYDSDPNRFAGATRLHTVNYETAHRIGGELIQTEAIEFAASKGIGINVAAIGQDYGSYIGDCKDENCANENFQRVDTLTAA